MSSSRRAFFPIILTVFIDLLGVGIVIPVLAILILGDSSLLPADTPAASKNIILGILLASYSLAQFFGAPMLGALADRFGRKKILILSLFGTVTGYIIFAWGISHGLIALLFLGRILDGLTGGNISIVHSAISDISDEKSRSRNFGLVGMAFGLGFILGPYLGGKLSDPSVVSWFDFSTPFWFAALLTTVNILFAVLFFQETIKKKVYKPFDLLTGPKNVIKAFSMINLRTLFLTIFLFSFGFSTFAQFFQVYLVQKFDFTQSQIGEIFAFIGLFIAFTQGVLNRPVSKKFAPSQVLSFSPILLSITLFCLLIPDRSTALFYVLPFVAIFNGLSIPNFNALMSFQAGEDSQGEIMGLNQSIHSLAQAIPPIIAGIIVSFDQRLPILVAGSTTAIAWLIFMLFYNRKSHAKFKEV